MATGLAGGRGRKAGVRSLPRLPHLPHLAHGCASFLGPGLLGLASECRPVKTLSSVSQVSLLSGVKSHPPGPSRGSQGYTQPGSQPTPVPH